MQCFLQGHPATPATRVHRPELPGAKGIGFPARKSNLLNQAKKNHAERAFSIFESMPDQDQRIMADLMKGFGETR